MSSKLAEALVSLFWAGVSLIFYYISLSFPPSKSGYEVGAGVFPRLLAGALLAFTMIHLFLTWRSHTRVKVVIDNVSKVVSNIVLLLVYLLCITYFGNFFIFTPLFLIVILRLLNVRSWLVIISVALLFDLFAYLVFYRILGVPLL